MAKNRHRWNAREILSLERALLDEFGPPDKVIQDEIDRHHRETRARLTGMPEEQADWDEGEDDEEGSEPG